MQVCDNCREPEDVDGVRVDCTNGPHSETDLCKTCGMAYLTFDWATLAARKYEEKPAVKPVKKAAGKRARVIKQVAGVSIGAVPELNPSAWQDAVNSLQGGHEGAGE